MFMPGGTSSGLRQSQSRNLSDSSFLRDLDFRGMDKDERD